MEQKRPKAIQGFRHRSNQGGRGTKLWREGRGQGVGSTQPFSNLPLPFPREKVGYPKKVGNRPYHLPAPSYSSQHNLSSESMRAESSCLVAAAPHPKLWQRRQAQEPGRRRSGGVRTQLDVAVFGAGAGVVEVAREPVESFLTWCHPLDMWPRNSRGPMVNQGL